MALFSQLQKTVAENSLPPSFVYVLVIVYRVVVNGPARPPPEEKAQIVAGWVGLERKRMSKVPVGTPATTAPLPMSVPKVAQLGVPTRIVTVAPTCEPVPTTRKSLSFQRAVAIVIRSVIGVGTTALDITEAAPEPTAFEALTVNE